MVMIVTQRYRIGSDMNRFRLPKDRPAQLAGVPAARAAASGEPLYARLAGALETQIRSGALQIGDRVASVRALSREQGVSVATVLQAIARLESQGFVEARPRSGHYVRTPFADLVEEPAAGPSGARPRRVGGGAIIAAAIAAASDPGKVPLAAACPDPRLLPAAALNRALRRALRDTPLHSTTYAFPPGLPALRRQIARRSLLLGCNLPPGEIVVTAGAMEAINVALRAVAKPGDVVALESPTYFGILQAVESMGMKAAEISTHPRTGLDLDRLENVIVRHKARAIVTMTNCHNPLGTIVEDDAKRALVDLATRHQVPLIEDDIYGDLAFDAPRPRTAKSFDGEGLVLLCSSFSKTLAPGFRIGWIHAGRYQAEVERLLFIHTVAAPSLPQHAVAAFLASGAYDRSLKRLRAAFRDQVRRTGRALAEHLPAGTRITRPAGGYVLWVELPERFDAGALARRALDAGIAVLPGPIFSATGRFRHHLRVSCGHVWSERIERAVATLGRLCRSA
jgi:DNA-binding transcriptional MocR family regulator